MRIVRIDIKRSGRNVLGWEKYSVRYVEGMTIMRKECRGGGSNVRV
jgi:hypothetical protein